MSNTTTTATTFRLLVVQGIGGHAVEFRADARLATEDEALALAASLPKKLKARVREVRDFTYPNATLYYQVTIEARLRATKNNEKNETGLRRLEALLASAPVENDPRGGYDTLADALAAIYSEVN